MIPEYSTQYALEAIKADEAWNTTTGDADVVVGVIDTGME